MECERLLRCVEHGVKVRSRVRPVCNPYSKSASLVFPADGPNGRPRDGMDGSPSVRHATALLLGTASYCGSIAGLQPATRSLTDGAEVGFGELVGTQRNTEPAIA